MEYAILDEHVRLNDSGGGVARGDERSGRVGAKVEVFAGSGDVGTVDQAWAVDGCSIDDMVPQNCPELSGVA